MGGQKNQNGSGWWFLQDFEEGIACCWIHCLGIGNNHHPSSCLIRFHGNGLTEGAYLINFDERPGRFHPDDVRVVTCLDFKTRFAFTAGDLGFMPNWVGNFPGTIARHRKCGGRAFFADPFYSGKQQGVRDGSILKEGG